MFSPINVTTTTDVVLDEATCISSYVVAFKVCTKELQILARINYRSTKR